MGETDRRRNVRGIDEIVDTNESGHES